MTVDSTKGLSNVIRIDDEQIQDYLGKIVRGSVEDSISTVKDACHRL